MIRYASFVLALGLLASCADAPADRETAQADAVNGTDTSDVLIHPEWSRNAVIYEMNIRQHSPKGDLRSAAADLARIKQLGVDIIWLMPVHPIGEVNRKGGENKDNYLVQPGSSSLGSPYSVQDYKALNPDYGTWEDFDAFVATARNRVWLARRRLPLSLQPLYLLTWAVLMLLHQQRNFQLRVCSH